MVGGGGMQATTDTASKTQLELDLVTLPVNREMTTFIE